MLGFAPAAVPGPATPLPPCGAQAWPWSRHITAEEQVTGRLGPGGQPLAAVPSSPAGSTLSQQTRLRKSEQNSGLVRLHLQHTALPVARACRATPGPPASAPRGEQDVGGGGAVRWAGLRRAGLRRAPLRQPPLLPPDQASRGGGTHRGGPGGTAAASERSVCGAPLTGNFRRMSLCHPLAEQRLQSRRSDRLYQTEVVPASPGLRDAATGQSTRLRLPASRGKRADARARATLGGAEANAARPEQPRHGPFCRQSAVTSFDLVVEVDGVHGSCDYVGLAVTCGHDPGHIVHELHGDTCAEKRQEAD